MAYAAAAHCATTRPSGILQKIELNCSYPICFRFTALNEHIADLNQTSVFDPAYHSDHFPNFTRIYEALFILPAFVHPL